MKEFVLDCSVYMAWCFEEENSLAAEKILESLSAAKALVPAVWPLEVANVLLVAERKKSIKEAETRRLIELLKAAPIQIDDVPPFKTFLEILSLAREHGLSSYDAAYLELAMRKSIPLATFDRKLQEVSKKVGIEPYKG